METRDDAKKNLDTLSGQISTLVRTLALGVLAVVWLFLSGSKEGAPILGQVPGWQLVSIAALAILAILSDLLQYVFAYKLVLRARQTALAADSEEVDYPDEDGYKKARFAFFRIKFWFALVAAAWLVVALAVAVIANLISDAH